MKFKISFSFQERSLIYFYDDSLFNKKRGLTKFDFFSNILIQKDFDRQIPKVSSRRKVLLRESLFSTKLDKQRLLFNDRPTANGGYLISPLD